MDFLESGANRLAFFSSYVNGWLYKLAAVAGGVMLIPTVLDVCSRWLFQQSLMGAMEIVEFCMVILVFSSLGYLQDRRSHIRVTLITEHFSVPVRNMLEIVSTLCPFLLMGLVSWCSFQNAMGRAATEEVSSMLGIPLYPFILFAALGCLVFALALCANFLKTAAEMVKARQLAFFVLGIALSALLLALPLLLHESSLAENYIMLGSCGFFLLMLCILLGMPIGLAMSLIGYIGMLLIYPNIQASFSMLG
ncbi:MAG: TRAP transporter small permease, partial [Mailhella sp.]